MTMAPSTPSRPSTPAALIESTSSEFSSESSGTSHSFLYDHETSPRTPVGSRIPMIFADAPLAPRPRKRVCQPADLGDNFDDIMLPSAFELHEQPQELDGDETTLHLSLSSRKPTTAPPAFPRLFRRFNLEHIRRKLDAEMTSTTTASAVSFDDENSNMDDKENNDNDVCDDKVRVAYRKAPSSLSASVNKVWPCRAPVTVGIKRRNSCNASCA